MAHVSPNAHHTARVHLQYKQNISAAFLPVPQLARISFRHITGADIITTNTYQASIEGFNKHLQLSSHQSYHLIKKAVQLAKQAIIQENANRIVEKKVLVAGSIGSYGACLHDGSEYHGKYAKHISNESLKNWHRPRMSALVDSGVDFLAIETIPALSEAEAILELLREFPQQKAWISFTCENGSTTVAQDRIGNAANKLWSMGKRQLVAIGVNCLKPSFVTPLIRDIRQANLPEESPIPTIAYPNSGENYNKTDKKWVTLPGSATIHSYAADWLNSGLAIIGGCCRTTAKDIQLLKPQVRAFNESAAVTAASMATAH
ncbi:homocysteine S-methyltransferase YbgG-like isoform X2 [Planococcus citri]|uniref:homocysteine S-methyltransferase YbgG-like isoform X2 n=1 Tax=Planococcus citri TaxID=170843 RepID=UPI0031F8CB54